MKRIITLTKKNAFYNELDGYSDEHFKYRLKETYGGWGIYEQITPGGISIYNSWLLVIDEENGTESKIQIQSYNNIVYDELFDAIENWMKTEMLGFRVMNNETTKENGYLIVHPNGNSKV